MIYLLKYMVIIIICVIILIEVINMNIILKTLAKNTSAFRHMAICALIIGAGDVVCAAVDLFWVLGDISVSPHWYHYYVLAGLIIANVLILGSFIWLVKSLFAYAKNHDNKVKAKRVHKAKVSKQSTVIIHLAQRVEELERKLEGK